MGRIFSPGKLLLTSEYFVLDGALALAVPTKPGQEFFFEELTDGLSEVYWEALHQGKPWLQARINYKTWTVIDTNLPQGTDFVLQLLQAVQQYSVIKFQDSTSYRLKTNLQFPSDYGLGSSSTLLNNICRWADCDAFLLNEILLHGSGYDIAVAGEGKTILFQNAPVRTVNAVHYSPPFKEELIFVHINKKQNSRAGIELYRGKKKSPDLIDRFSKLTEDIFRSTALSEFVNHMELHENLVSEFLGLPKVKESSFSDYDGMIKSLGAWGGDFVMVSKHGNYHSYFTERGYTHLFEWDELILSQ